MPGLRHGGFFSGGRTATFILPSNLLHLYSFCGDPPARKNTNIFVNYIPQGSSPVRGSEGSWITTIFQYNTIPGAQGSIITLELNSGNMPLLPRRWSLEIGYLYSLTA